MESESAWTASEMRKAGWTNTYALQGGIKAWEAANLPIVTGPSPR